MGEETISALTDDRKSRRMLDEVWDDGGVDACLADGQWAFATRTVKLDYDTDISPEFGYRYAFAKPSDWVRTMAISTDEYFNVPLNQYTDEQGYWYTDEQELYVSYVSNHANWGGDLSTWPQPFADFAAAYFASRAIFNLTSDDDRLLMVKNELKESRINALNHDASGDPARFPPQGTWSRSRQGSRGRNRDRGSRGNLIG